MADVNKALAPGCLALRTWDEFTRAMAPYTDQFDQTLREHILVALYHRAAQRAWLEDLRFKEKVRAPRLRRERIRADRTRRHIQNAIRSLTKVGTGNSVQSLATDSVRDAIRLLETAVEDLRFLEELLIALVHPDLRIKTEKGRGIESTPTDHWNLFSGFGKAKVDQMFIGWMERYLSSLVTKNGARLSSGVINRIIVATLKAAFTEHVEEEAVRTARRRLAKQHPESRQK